MDSDIIMVLDNGCLVDHGNHESDGSPQDLRYIILSRRGRTELPDNASGTGVKENVRVMHGPGPRGRGMGGKIDFKTLKKEKDIFTRLLGYIWKPYRFRLMCVLLCIIAGAVTSAAGNLFLQRLIDNYVAPLLGSNDPVFTPLIKAIAVMGCIYMAASYRDFDPAPDDRRHTGHNEKRA